jgi:hypothetical protein
MTMAEVNKEYIAEIRKELKKFTNPPLSSSFTKAYADFAIAKLALSDDELWQHFCPKEMVEYKMILCIEVPEE